MFNCVRSSILANSVEIFADVHICFVPDNFYFLIFEKFNSKIGELSSRKLHSRTFNCNFKSEIERQMAQLMSRFPFHYSGVSRLKPTHSPLSSANCQNKL